MSNRTNKKTNNTFDELDTFDELNDIFGELGDIESLAPLYSPKRDSSHEIRHPNITVVINNNLKSRASEKPPIAQFTFGHSQGFHFSFKSASSKVAQPSSIEETSNKRASKKRKASLGKKLVAKKTKLRRSLRSKSTKS